MMKGKIEIGSGMVMQETQVHGHLLQDNEVAIVVETLKTSSPILHSKHGYQVEEGGFTAWNINDVVVEV